MKKYHVLLKAIVNVKVIQVEAESPKEAAEKAREQVWPRLYDHFKWETAKLWNKYLKPEEVPADGLVYTEFGEDIEEALVDEVGDEEYERSQWLRMREAPNDRQLMEDHIKECEALLKYLWIDELEDFMEDRGITSVTKAKQMALLDESHVLGTMVRMGERLGKMKEEL